MLSDPAQPWEPWAPQEPWNHKLYWLFGGDCTPNHVQTAVATSAPASRDVLLDMALSRGFAVATSG